MRLRRNGTMPAAKLNEARCSGSTFCSVYASWYIFSPLALICRAHSNSVCSTRLPLKACPAERYNHDNYNTGWPQKLAPLVCGVAGLSASSSSKADTLNIWYKNCRMWQLLLTITETINTLFPAVNLFKCVVTEVALFSIVALTTLTFHKVV